MDQSRARRLRGLAGYGIGLLIILCLYLALRKDTHAVQGMGALATPLALSISLAAGLAASVLSAWSWHAALRVLGAGATFRDASRVWYVSMAARYVPGTIPGIAIRVYLTTRIGVSSTLAATATALDWVCWVVSALLAGILTSPWWIGSGAIFHHPLPGAVQVGLLGGAAALGLLVMHPRVVGLLIRKAAQRAGKTIGPDGPVPDGGGPAPGKPAVVTEMDANLSYRRILSLIPIYLVKWPFYGLSISAFLYALTGAVHGPVGAIQLIPVATAAFAVGWVVGFVSPFAPGGVGVREGVIVGVLQGMAAGDALLAAALLSRLTTTIGEVLCWIWAIADQAAARRRQNNDIEVRAIEPSSSSRL